MSERSTDLSHAPTWNASASNRIGFTKSWDTQGASGVSIGKGNRIAIYLRVSTIEQHVDNQLPIIETYMKANFPFFYDSPRFWDAGEKTRGFDIFWDHESAKGGVDRDAFGKLFNRIQGKKYDDVICWHVDRCSRNIEDFSRIMRYSTAAECTWHFASLQMRTSDPMMMFMCKFFALWGEHEVALKELRQKEGIARRRKAGLHMGRKPDMQHDDNLFELLRKEPNMSIAAVGRHFGKSRDWARKAIDRVSERTP